MVRRGGRAGMDVGNVRTSAEWPPIPDLRALQELQERVGRHYLAPGFELLDRDDDGLRTWSRDPEFLGALYVFAQANDTGSQYVLWRVDDRPDPASLPVVVF